jgi:hypothetical protein
VTDHDPRADYDDEPGRPSGPAETMSWAGQAISFFALLQLAPSILALVGTITIFVLAAANGGFPPTLPLADVALVFAVALLSVAWNALILRGAVGMPEFRGYRRAILSAVLVIPAVPVVGLAVLTLPLGVWVLIALSRPEVRARFAAADGATMNAGDSDSTERAASDHA